MSQSNIQFNERDLERIRIQQEGNDIMKRMFQSINIGVSNESLEEFVGIKIERETLNNYEI